MSRCLALIALTALVSTSALALDMPSRKAGLWEISMSFVGHKTPPQVMKQCIDAASDKLMNANVGGSIQQKCSKQDIERNGSGMTIDSVCNFGGGTTTTHAVMTGSFDSAYTMDVTSKRQGGPAVPGLSPNGQSHTMISAKWLGPCEAGQRPGDMIMSNGMKINVLDLQKMKRPAR
jgi:hypothetical protein